MGTGWCPEAELPQAIEAARFKRLKAIFAAPPLRLRLRATTVQGLLDEVYAIPRNVIKRENALAQCKREGVPIPDINNIVKII